MMSQGLQQEIRQLLAAGVPADSQAMKGIGYKELLPVLAMEEAAQAVSSVSGPAQLSLQQAVADIQKNSRHFAKRQLTWYRRMPYIHWYQPELYPDMEKLADNVLWDVRRWLDSRD